jgi:hypothetical protein
MATKKKEPKAAKVEAPEKVAAPEVAVTGPKWIKVTAEQLAKLQEEGKLAGYRPDTNEALIN